MPYKRSSRISRHFWSSDFARITNQKEFFNNHACYRQQMYLRYPVRNFKCPFCGTRMPTETYRGWQPWLCPGCSHALQFSTKYDIVLQLCTFGIALLCLYSVGVAGWHLAVGTILVGLVLTVVAAGPLSRVIPPRLEPYEPPPWKQPKYLTLFPDERIDSDVHKQTDSSRAE